LSIAYLPYKQIDKTKWDACIDKAPNGLVYAYSLYLDTMADNWDALVLNDYEAVMPLTWKKKYGIQYLYQPFLTACLGVFGNNISAELINSFLKTIPVKFRYWDIYLNHGNYFSLADFKLYQRSNYILSLNDSYEVLSAKFRNNIKRNIKKAAELDCITKTNIDVDDIITLSEQQFKNFSSATKVDFENFKTLYNQLSKEEKAITYGVYTSDAQLVASGVFFFSHNRAYYILVGNHPNSKAVGASHALINAFIKDHSGKNLILDFEGSDVGNLAFFYSSFGAVRENYAAIKLNKLPRLLRFLKSQ
jgi:GNAT acetyltransferase-like protein